MPVQTEYDYDTVTLHLTGDINHSEFQNLDDAIQDIISNENTKHARVNLSQMKTINSTGIGKLLKLYKHISQAGGNYRFVELPDRIREMFRTFHFDKIIPLD
jgi:anti-anti-sigma factor